MKLFISLLFTLNFFGAEGVSAAPRTCERASERIISNNELIKLTDVVCGPYRRDSYDGPHGEEMVRTAKQELIYEYSSFCYGPINQTLWGSLLLNPEATLQLAEQLDLILCELPEVVGTTYRGLKLSLTQLKEFRAGNLVTLPAFTSTSLDISTACGFSGNAMMVIHSKTGRSISDFAQKPEEEEVLMRPGTEFKVVAVNTNEKEIRKKLNCVRPSVLIELEEIPTQADSARGR